MDAGLDPLVKLSGKYFAQFGLRTVRKQNFFVLKNGQHSGPDVVQIMLINTLAIIRGFLFFVDD